MESGLTIAFICNGDNHPTFKNYNKFGNKFWNDGKNNNSKVGYYFAYYFRKKYVYIHKIINITNETPEGIVWDSNRKWLWLSERLNIFTWDEWIKGIGFGSPYTPDYYSTQTYAWSYKELQKFKNFNFVNFKNTIEQKVGSNNIQLVIDEPVIIYETSLEDEEEELMRQIEEVRKKKLLRDINKKLPSLREKHINELNVEICVLKQQITDLRLQIIKKEQEQKDTNDGLNDTILINKELSLIKN